MLRRSDTGKGAMNARRVAVSPEIIRLSCQVGRVPKERAIRYSRRIVPMSRSTNGCDIGTYGTDLISLISITRRLATPNVTNPANTLHFPTVGSTTQTATAAGHDSTRIDKHD